MTGNDSAVLRAAEKLAAWIEDTSERSDLIDAAENLARLLIARREAAAAIDALPLAEFEHRNRELTNRWQDLVDLVAGAEAALVAAYEQIEACR